MAWYHYIAVFFCGAFLANTIPHFVYGVCGNKFPTPFAKPPGKGLSSAPVNVLWALVNLVVAYLLFTVAPIDSEHKINLILFFLGIAAMSLQISVHFQGKHKETPDSTL